MKKLSAGILLHRRSPKSGRLEILLVHPGGPFWARKDAGAWGIPKGEYEPEDDPYETAQREFSEETGMAAPTGEAFPLGEIRQPSGKVITAWAIEGDLDVSKLKSNEFEMEWPKGSGKMQSFPEVDRAEWLEIPKARHKILKGQAPFVDKLIVHLVASGAVQASEVDEPEEISLF